MAIMKFSSADKLGSNIHPMQQARETFERPNGDPKIIVIRVPVGGLSPVKARDTVMATRDYTEFFYKYFHEVFVIAENSDANMTFEIIDVTSGTINTSSENPHIEHKLLELIEKTKNERQSNNPFV